MAERYYVWSTTSPAGSPAFSTNWEQTASADRRPAFLAKDGSALNNTARLDTGTSGDDTCLLGVLIGPIGAGPVSGTILCQFRASEGAAGADSRSQMVARVVAPDFTTFRGQLVGMNTGGLSQELSTTSTNHQWPLAAPFTMSSVTAQAGDYVWLEFGTRRHATGAAQNMRIVYGAPNTTDYGADETDTSTTKCPYIEFGTALPALSMLGPRMVLIA